MDREQAYAKLERYGQTHLLRFYNELDENAKASLLSQIEKIDLGAIRKPRIKDTKGDVIEPHPALALADIKKDHDKYYETGLKAVKENKIAALILAGGQGTRLGISGPKGTLNVGITKELYIFECLVKNLMKVTDAAGNMIPLLIMTSEINDEATRAFFKEHEYFGYDPGRVYFFVQEMVACADYDLKVYLEEKGKIAMSPNGYGGWFRALCRAGLDKKLKEEGVEYINIFSVDNVLQKMADPVFLGAVIEGDFPVGSKVIRKNAPEEKVGVMCKRNGRPSIIEYYELTEQMRNLRDENGELVYTFGVILNYIFRMKELTAIADDPLPLHVVEKKIPHINDNGNLIRPDEPNGYKYETLALDMIEMMPEGLVFEVEREKEFAPIKNLHGVDSLDSAREMLAANGVEL